MRIIINNGDTHMTDTQFSEIINIMFDQDCSIQTACELLGYDNKISKQAIKRYIEITAA
jgi:hypothetical protein